MIRLIILLLLVSSYHHSLSQNKAFDRYTEEINTYKTNQNEYQIPHKKSIQNWDDYELKWEKIRGTYGGSPYCCEGKVFRVRNPKKPKPSTEYLTPIGKAMNHHFTLIGERYIIEKIQYEEPLPTSAFHSIYVLRYYERK